MDVVQAPITGFLVGGCSLSLRMYHYIRGESFLKLYVLFNMLET